MAPDRHITLRLTIPDPVPGIAYSLQNKKSEPIGKLVAGDQPISFDVKVRVADGPRFLGDFVRSEGPVRRFVYIAIGAQTGDPTATISRRAKIDIHDIPADLLEQALAGSILEAQLPGRDKKGDPACASLRPLGSWKVAE